MKLSFGLGLFGLELRDLGIFVLQYFQHFLFLTLVFELLLLESFIKESLEVWVLLAQNVLNLGGCLRSQVVLEVGDLILEV